MTGIVAIAKIKKFGLFLSFELDRSKSFGLSYFWAIGF
jgi:hypothetical protein